MPAVVGPAHRAAGRCSSALPYRTPPGLRRADGAGVCRERLGLKGCDQGPCRLEVGRLEAFAKARIGARAGGHQIDRRRPDRRQTVQWGTRPGPNALLSVRAWPLVRASSMFASTISIGCSGKSRTCRAGDPPSPDRWNRSNLDNAETIGRPLATVKTWLRRALSELKEAFEEAEALPQNVQAPGRRRGCHPHLFRRGGLAAASRLNRSL